MHWFISLVFHRLYQTPLLLSVYKGLKYLIRVTTQTTEIGRLCALTTAEKISSPSSAILYRLDTSIFYSRQLVEEKQALQQVECEVETVAQSISLKKNLSRSATKVLLLGLIRIHQANNVLNTVEQKVQTKYDTANAEHEAKLMLLWEKMKPEERLTGRITKQWVDIGFQGSDPATDFRGMGIQGLDDLLYFVETYPDHAKSVLQHASHPVSWYPYAIVGINLTKFGYQLLESKKLQMFLFHQYLFEDFYCYLFYEFNQFWIHHKPALTVMDFEVTLDQFKKKVENDLFLDIVKPLA